MLNLFGLEQKEEKIDEEVKVKPITIFDYLKDIRINKKGNIHLQRDPSLSKFDTFMMLRFLSLEDGYLPYINIINEFQDNLTKEEAYKLLVVTIPKSNKFLNFPKKKENNIDEEDVELLSRYFICSKYEAEDFIKLNLINKNDVEKIKLMYGGKS